MLMKTDDRETGLARLEELADILDAADAEHVRRGEQPYNQDLYTWPCGTPACALGHWAAANSDRWVFLSVRLSTTLPVLREFSWNFSSAMVAWDVGAYPEFGISRAEANMLFGTGGCGEARSGRDAARYIRGFAAAKRATGSGEVLGLTVAA